ncbi:MAG: hypothetical protein EPN20_16820 [Magnetospirillum sp.]|nr:MAG: hypothetical protein EPN20_16820 [Magnetospirillum sp.]
MNPKLVVAIALLLMGCGTMVSTWEKPGASEEEERAILKKCEYEAEAHSEEGVMKDNMRHERVKKLRDMCLEANGMVRIKQEFIRAQ